jgi:hypothetical protein
MDFILPTGHGFVSRDGAISEEVIKAIIDFAYTELDEETGASQQVNTSKCVNKLFSSGPYTRLWSRRLERGRADESTYRNEIMSSLIWKSIHLAFPNITINESFYDINTNIATDSVRVGSFRDSFERCVALLSSNQKWAMYALSFFTNPPPDPIYRYNSGEFQAFINQRKRDVNNNTFRVRIPSYDRHPESRPFTTPFRMPFDMQPLDDMPGAMPWEIPTGAAAAPPKQAQMRQPEVRPMPDEADDEYKAKLVDRIRCPVCYENESNTVLIPCGHLLCSQCVARGLRECPICRKEITSNVSIYYQKYLKYKTKYLNALKQKSQ